MGYNSVNSKPFGLKFNYVTILDQSKFICSNGNLFFSGSNDFKLDHFQQECGGSISSSTSAISIIRRKRLDLQKELCCLL